MNYCHDSTKTTITYLNSSGIKYQITFNQGDIDIECTDDSPIAMYLFTVHDGGYNENCTPQHESTFYVNTFLADSYVVSDGTSPYSNVAQCSWTKLTFYTGGNISATQNFPSAYHINRSNNPDYTPNGKLLLLKDSTGKLLDSVKARDCNFKVACDDGCPEGFCKCIIPEYPGYCCLDCNATAASIRAITNDLRGKNGR